jgi:tRNA pseudouridine65 synthase
MSMLSSKLEILHRDEVLLAVSKPSGMLVHRGWGRDDEVLVDVVRRLVGRERVHPAHRLDRGTSGVVLIALDAIVARDLGRALDDGAMNKRYLAVVRGRPPDHAVVEHPLPRRPGGPRVPATSEVRRLATFMIEPRHLSLVEVRPRTGRLHQVRRHLKHLGHPVIGDSSYGNGPLNREVASRWGLARLALHAHSLELVHPRTGEPLRLVASVPADLHEPLRRMGLDQDLL